MFVPAFRGAEIQRLAAALNRDGPRLGHVRSALWIAHEFAASTFHRSGGGRPRRRASTPRWEDEPQNHAQNQQNNNRAGDPEQYAHGG